MSEASEAVAEIHPPDPDVAVALLGVGGVGHALLGQLAERELAGLRLVALANSTRQLIHARGLHADTAAEQLQTQDAARDDADVLAALDVSGAGKCVVIDATGSDQVAGEHPGWLARGYHVVTANKALNGGPLPGWQAIATATRASGARYGSSATVGAGLPVIDTLRRWAASGDRVERIEGVFSGSLSWLFNHYDGERPFSQWLWEARDQGFCEPDPRVDLSGVDAARKLLILARTAGLVLPADAVQIDNLVPASLRDVSADAFADGIAVLDQAMAERYAEAHKEGRVLRYVARFGLGRAHVGLQAVAPDAPVADLDGSENLFVLASQSYDGHPVIIRGPGAGPTVTAQALLADVMQLV